MKIWKKGVLAIVAAVAVTLIYPGFPSGASLQSNANRATLTCFYSHWSGTRSKTIDMSTHIKNGGISMGNGPCYTWANWKP